MTADAALRARFARKGVEPRTVIVMTIAEVYSQCSRALQRSELWAVGDQSANLPTAGDMLADASAGRIGGQIDAHAYDAERAARMKANPGLW